MNGLISRAGLIATMLGAILVSTPGAHSAPKAKVQKAAVQPTEFEIRRAGFSGSELRLRLFAWVNADCSSGSRPEVRIVKGPKNGEMTFKEVYSAVELPRGYLRSRCNGQPLSGVGLFYTSNDDFTGQERMTVDVGYQDGVIHRHNVVVDVR